MISRANSPTFADDRLVVCLCKAHHGWKSLGGNYRKELYDEIVRSLLPTERVLLWQACERERWKPQRMYQSDLKKALAFLQNKLTEAIVVTNKNNLITATCEKQTESRRFGERFFLKLGIYRRQEETRNRRWHLLNSLM